MALVTRRAAVHIEYAIDLAARGAVYSAREEFVKALSVISHSLDADAGSRVHSQALTAALRALREADDFSLDNLGADAGTDVELVGIVARHETPVLKKHNVAAMSPLIATQHYYLYAQQNLVLACGRQRAGAVALCGLARIRCYVADNHESWQTESLDRPRAIAMYRAALEVDPSNHVAANELGVLLAQYGQPREARELFLRSLSISPQPQTWYNLAKASQNLGDLAGARHAFSQHRNMLQNNPISIQPRHAYWVDPDKFALTSNCGQAAFDTIKPGLAATEAPADQMTAKTQTRTGKKQEPETLLSGLQKFIERF
jgi:tetratricopeptide (TPR) repeat protein